MDHGQVDLAVYTSVIDIDQVDRSVNTKMTSMMDDASLRRMCVMRTPVSGTR